MNDLMIFEGNEVEVYELNGQVWIWVKFCKDGNIQNEQKTGHKAEKFRCDN